MKADSIKVGSKKVSLYVEVPDVQMPDTLADMFTQYGVSVPEPVVKFLATVPQNAASGIVRTHVRGLRIEKQERSGARDFVEANGEALRKGDKAKLAEVYKMVREFLPGVSKSVGRPKAPTSIEVKGGKGGTVDAAALIEALKAKGITVNIQ